VLSEGRLADDQLLAGGDKGDGARHGRLAELAQGALGFGGGDAGLVSSVGRSAMALRRCCRGKVGAAQGLDRVVDVEGLAAAGLDFLGLASLEGDAAVADLLVVRP